jgi:hypothetical protein
MSYNKYKSDAVTEHLIDGVGGPVYESDYVAFFEEVTKGLADGSTMLRLSNGEKKLVLEIYANVDFRQGLEQITALLKRQGKQKQETINSQRLIENSQRLIELRGIYTTALFTAALWKREGCVKILIRAGATIKACSSWKLWMKKFESSENHKDILKLLKEQLEKENV